MLAERTRFAALYVAMMVVIATGSGCGDSKVKTGSSVTDAITVTAVQVVDQTVTPTLRYSGTIEAWNRAALGSEIPGRIVELNCDVGDVVRRDSLLVRLGSETLIQARAQYDVATQDWTRIQTLREQGTVSQQTYDRMKASFEGAKAGYEKTLISTQIRAPFTGVVTSKYLDVGEVFTLMPGQAGSPAIIELMQIDPVKVVIAVTESQYHRIGLHQQATLTLDAYPGIRFIGSVSKIAPTIDIRTRTADVEIRLANKDGTIKPGMFGFVTLSLPSTRALLLNRDALIKQEGTGDFYVFRVEGEVATRVNIIKGDDFGDGIEIKSGLAPGDTVITSGKMRVTTGSKVKLAPAEGTE